MSQIFDLQNVLILPACLEQINMIMLLNLLGSLPGECWSPVRCHLFLPKS